MKNFDSKRRERLDADRSFIIGGEEFSYRPGVRPEDILPWFQMRTGETVGSEAGEAMLTQAQQVAVYDATVIAHLEPGQEEKWKRVRLEADPPITLKDLDDLVDWLFEEQTGRPTSQPSDSGSGSGSGETGTNSTEASPSVAEPTSPA